MRSSNLCIAVAAWLLAGCATAPPPTKPKHAAAHKPAKRPRVRLATDDVLGRPVRVGPSQPGPVSVVYLMTRDSREESSELARDVDKQLLERPIEQVAIVDLHKLSSFSRGIARSQLRKAANESLEKRRQRREAQGVDASPRAVNRWHLIGDFDGRYFELFDVPRDLQHPLVFVVDRSGRVRGPYRDATRVEAAIRRADHGYAAR
jgi:hypothetical protein